MENMALSTLSSPVILFFVLGMIAGAVRSDLAIPEQIAKGMSLYLMAAIGLKGGVAVAKSGFSIEMAVLMVTGVAFSFLIPIYVSAAFRSFGRLSQIDASAVGAHYGSVSVVTLVTAMEVLAARSMPVAGYMVAVLAVMETPAILSGLLLARRGKPGASKAANGDLLHEVFLNASVVLLMGSFVIGIVAGAEGFSDIRPVFDSGFKGILCLFLLDMGLIAARRLRESKLLTWRLGLLAIAFPLLNGVLGTLAAWALGMDAGSSAAFGILCASASYIAVPAAMRIALPEADAGIYLTMSLSITFPFNIIVGIGLIASFAALLPY